MKTKIVSIKSILFRKGTAYLCGVLFLLSGCGSGLCNLQQVCGVPIYGVLDNSFGVRGIVNGTTAPGANVTKAYINPDGSFYVFGGYLTDFFVKKFKTDGSVDNSFGTNGFVTVNVGVNDTAYSLSIQSNGKIVVLGPSTALGTFALARLYSNGALDTTFGTGGMTVSSFTGADTVLSSAVLSDDKIIAAGHGLFSNQVAIARYTAQGILDTTFGTAGSTLSTLNGTDVEESLRNICIQSDGKMIATGLSQDGGSIYHSITVRYHANGSLDTTFASASIYDLNIIGGITHDTYGRNLICQPNNKILLLGDYTTSISNMIMIRLLPNGTLDTSFGEVTKSFSSHLFNKKIIQDSSDKIYVAGYRTVGAQNDFVIMRYLSNGTLDTTFGANGIVTTNVDTTDYLLDFTILSSGKLQIVGTTTGSDIAVLRYR